MANKQNRLKVASLVLVGFLMSSFHYGLAVSDGYMSTKTNVPIVSEQVFIALENNARLETDWYSLTEQETSAHPFSLEDIPAYYGQSFVPVHRNIPDFSSTDMTIEAFETYSDLDDLGRCGTAYANICPELMPVEERGSIGGVRPSGWHTVRYDDIVDGRYLYNRCHLIGFQLAGENANPNNLITGTRYMNTSGMLSFENMVASYVIKTGHHVLYRVTPVFVGNNLVAAGVHIEALSVEDQGAGISFNIFCYNVQPGIQIDYQNGESWINEMWAPMNR